METRVSSSPRPASDAALASRTSPVMADGRERATHLVGCSDKVVASDLGDLGRDLFVKALLGVEALFVSVRFLLCVLISSLHSLLCHRFFLFAHPTSDPPSHGQRTVLLDCGVPPPPFTWLDPCSSRPAASRLYRYSPLGRRERASVPLCVLRFMHAQTRFPPLSHPSLSLYSLHSQRLSTLRERNSQCPRRYRPAPACSGS